MLACFWPDSTVSLSWYNGSGPGFVDASQAMSGRGDASVHRLSPPTVHIVDNRAFVEMAAGIEARIDLGGLAADLVSYTRIIYRLEHRDTQWRITALDCIYERDTLIPATPGQEVAVPAEELAPYRPTYALLAWHLARRGYQAGMDLLGDDQPARTAAFYTDTRQMATR